MDFLNFDDSSSDFSEFGESDDITYIDPDFGVVLSSIGSLDGRIIDYDTSVVLGTKGDDFIFAKSDHELENGNLVHGIEGFDDLSEENIGILFMSIMLMMVLRIQ